MIRRLVEAVMEHFGITDEQVEKIKTIMDMVEFKEVNGKKIAYLTIGEGIEVKIVQPDKSVASQGPVREKAKELDKFLEEKSFFGSQS